MQSPDERSKYGRHGGRERVITWMRLKIQEGAWQKGDVLPTIDALAEKTGVSRFTVWKAVKSLVAEGTLVANRGGRIRFGSAGEPADHFRWENLAQQISESIYNGDFASGTLLPPASKLQMRFSASYPTVHKALTVLSSQHVITRTGTRYLVPGTLSKGSVLQVVLFSEGVVETNESQRELVQLSEQQAHKLGVRLVRHEHTFSKPFNTIEVQKLCNRDTVAGFVVDFWGLGSAERSSNFLSLMTILLAARKPMAILDEVGDGDFPDNVRSNKHVRVIATAGRMAGEDIGEFLLKSGHRCVAFLTIAPDQVWAQRRFAGLKSAFVNAGVSESAVKVFYTTPQAGVSQLVCAAANLSRKEIKTLFGPSLTEAQLDALLSEAPDLAKRLHLKKDEIEQIHRQAKIAINLFHAGGSEGIAEMVNARIFELIGHQYGDRFINPTFEKIASDTSITAWVAATDGLGLPAQRFLQEHSGGLAKRISLVSFDNTWLSVAHNLTSYDWDAPGRLHHAFSFASGRREFGSRTHETIEWPGILYQR